MSKPIFLIQVSVHFTNEEVDSICEKLQGKLNDWHVLVVNSLYTKEILFTAFSEQAATDIELESFKEMIQNQLKQVI